MRIMHLDFEENQINIRKELCAFVNESIPQNWVDIWHEAPDAIEVGKKATKGPVELGSLTYHWPQDLGGHAGGGFPLGAGRVQYTWSSLWLRTSIGMQTARENFAGQRRECLDRRSSPECLVFGSLTRMPTLLERK
jgi:hypothetical protein